MMTAQTPDISGERQSGQDVRTQNVMACQAVANIVKSSLGPVGLDKMLVDDIGDITITNDGATILKMLEVEHPAAKVLVELAELQDREVGDGTTSVVIISAELLKVGWSPLMSRMPTDQPLQGYWIPFSLVDFWMIQLYVQSSSRKSIACSEARTRGIIEEVSDRVEEEQIEERMLRIKGYQNLKHILKVTKPAATVGALNHFNWVLEL
ncbi:hypothetical protein OROMI_013841 [Orobanche minor]